jgi:hypothetical protein
MQKLVFISITSILLIGLPAFAADNKIDTDMDGINDYDEMNIYGTDPDKADTDKDGFSDFEELKLGYSPLNPKKIKLEDSDADKDGLSDRMELNFKTNPSISDSDGDGFKDGDEISRGYDPLAKNPVKLKKRITINTKTQELSNYLGSVRLNIFKVSTGKPGMRTPIGDFKIVAKSTKAWSRAYGLWMPYWVGLGTGKFGIHELPYWPGGYREGESHLGKPVSHGCIRLGRNGEAKKIYDFAEIGLTVEIR